MRDSPKIKAVLKIDLKRFPADEIESLWIANRNNYGDQLRDEIANACGVSPFEVELSIKGEIIFGPYAAILEIDCTNQKRDWPVNTVESELLVRIWMGLPGLDTDDIRIEVAYPSELQTFTITAPEMIVKQLFWKKG